MMLLPAPSGGILGLGGECDPPDLSLEGMTAITTSAPGGKLARCRGTFRIAAEGAPLFGARRPTPGACVRFRGRPVVSAAQIFADLEDSLIGDTVLIFAPLETYDEWTLDPSGPQEEN